MKPKCEQRGPSGENLCERVAAWLYQFSGTHGGGGRCTVLKCEVHKFQTRDVEDRSTTTVMRLNR